MNEGTALPEEAKAAIWRIFGAGESPTKRVSTYDLIDPVIKKYVLSTDRDRIIEEIRAWFECDGNQSWLKSEMAESVASLIVEGVGTRRDENAIWAIASIESDFAAHVVRSRWSSEEIDSFVECALYTLENLCNRDVVLDASRIGGLDSGRTKIPKDAVQREGVLETFLQLQTHGFDLVYHVLHRAVARLIELVIKLCPNQFKSLIERLDHPVVRARAASCILDVVRPLDHRETLSWIEEDSCDALVALAILHTLNAIDGMDGDVQSARHTSVDYVRSTELQRPQDDVDGAAINLLNSLVDRLATLKPSTTCTRWIGELLSSAPYVLYRSVNHGIPPRIKQLERACTLLMARLVCESWSDDLLPEFNAGLRRTPRLTWTRYLADIAWEIRDVEPARAVEIAQLTLGEHERQVTKELERSHLFLNWRDWHDREWFRGLGIALALSREELHLPSWVEDQCRSLPLSVWDVEEDHRAFMAADRAVQHWFLVALHAITPRKELGRPVDPAAIRALAKIFWAHCRFARKFRSLPEDSVVAEYMARSVVKFGEPSNTWLLDLARDLGVDPRALWALFDQRRVENLGGHKTDVRHDQVFATEFARIASDRFGNEGYCDMSRLRFWGLLWLLVRATDEAEQTAMAIVRSPLKAHNRADKILALKLLSFVASRKRLVPNVADCLASLYGELWHGYTPREEREDRQEIDELLKQGS